MKYLIFVGCFGFSSLAMAVSECGGRAADGSFVTVHIETKGSVASADEGSITIEAGGNKYGYKISHDEISQYFENDDPATGSAIVGTIAYVKKDFPVSTRYVGQNFVDMDLKTIVDSGKADTKGNFMRVWKGPNHLATDQFSLSKVACAVWSNI